MGREEGGIGPLKASYRFADRSHSAFNETQSHKNTNLPIYLLQEPEKIDGQLFGDGAGLEERPDRTRRRGIDAGWTWGCESALIRIARNEGDRRSERSISARSGVLPAFETSQPNSGFVPMSAWAPLHRALLVTAVLGALITVGLWAAVQTAVGRSAAGVELPADVAAIEAFESSAGRTAGRVVLLFGALATAAAAASVASLIARRQRLDRAISQRIELLTAPLDKVRLAPPSDPGSAANRLVRQLAEARATIQRRLVKLDSERRRGFQVLDHMTDGVVAVDADRRVLLLNPAARRLLRLTRESLLGRRLAEVVRVPQIVSAVDAVLSGESPEERECDFPTDDERFLKVQALPLAVDGSTGVLITIRDESQRRQLERMRREFIANVSHELKTPLAAIKGYAETLQLGAKEDPDTCTHFLKQIGLQAERLERLINDMLQLARAQAGTENLKLTNVSLTPVLRESIATYEPLAEAREITLQFAPPSPGSAVVADREALLTIVNNLVGNAVRYTPAGGHVELRCEAAGDTWKIVVADDGIGIPEQDQERIFERFYRVEKARDASRGGTGLGLSIVKNLVQALGGEVLLRSRPGEGSTFEVRLPAIR